MIELKKILKKRLNKDTLKDLYEDLLKTNESFTDSGDNKKGKEYLELLRKPDTVQIENSGHQNKLNE